MRKRRVFDYLETKVENTSNLVNCWRSQQQEIIAKVPNAHPSERQDLLVDGAPQYPPYIATSRQRDSRAIGAKRRRPEPQTG